MVDGFGDGLYFLKDTNGAIMRRHHNGAVLKLGSAIYSRRIQADSGFRNRSSKRFCVVRALGATRTF